MDDASDIEMEGDAPAAHIPSTSFLPSLVSPLLALLQPTSLSFPPLAAPSPHPPTTSALSAIHISALECLNNVFLSLATSPNPSVSADKDSGRKVWADIWSALAAVGIETGPGQERRQEMWEVAVGVLWGVGIVWKGVLVSRTTADNPACPDFKCCKPPNDEQVRVLIQLCEAASDPRTQVKCIGTLECLAQHPDSVDGNKVRQSTCIVYTVLMAWLDNIKLSTLNTTFGYICTPCWDGTTNTECFGHYRYIFRRKYAVRRQLPTGEVFGKTCFEC